jgi:hypothetical protein
MRIQRNNFFLNLLFYRERLRPEQRRLVIRISVPRLEIRSRKLPPPARGFDGERWGAV